jgi:hypothetical protein
LNICIFSRFFWFFKKNWILDWNFSICLILFQCFLLLGFYFLRKIFFGNFYKFDFYDYSKFNFLNFWILNILKILNFLLEILKLFIFSKFKDTLTNLNTHIYYTYHTNHTHLHRYTHIRLKTIDMILVSIRTFSNIWVAQSNKTQKVKSARAGAIWRWMT